MLLRTFLPTMLLSLLARPAAAQFIGEGTHVFENETIRIELLSDGWALDKVEVSDKVLRTVMVGQGEYRAVMIRDDDSEAAGESTGWYEFQTTTCNFSLEEAAPGTIRLSRYGCTDGTPDYEGVLRTAAGATGSLPVIAAKQIGEGRFKDWGPKPAEDAEDGPPEHWVYWSDMCEGPQEVSASSSMAGQGTRNYLPRNLADGNPTTAWVEGKSDHGVGEFIEIAMAPYSSGIFLLNGYQASRAAWENNGRVRVLQVSVNGTAVCIVQLADRMGVQNFELPSVVMDGLNDAPVIRLTIMDVYPGLKWTDTAISEIWTCGG